jgi:hypothetical protein
MGKTFIGYSILFEAYLKPLRVLFFAIVASAFVIPIAHAMTVVSNNSAYRHPEVSYEELRAVRQKSEQFEFSAADLMPAGRLFGSLMEKDAPTVARNRTKKSAEDSGTQFEKVNWMLAPDLQTMSVLNTAFTYVRNTKFLEDPVNTAKVGKRRLTWLYPDDGCFARAELARRLLVRSSGAIPVKKIFIFGSLQAATDNSASGKVTWWYHVAPIVRVGSSLFVIDPALHIKSPLPILDWVMMQTKSLSNVRLALCSGSTYGPDSDCNATAMDFTTVVDDQKSFLPMEWSRQKFLGRDPVKVLGDSPPWQ